MQQTKRNQNVMKSKFTAFALLATALTMGFSSCDKEEDPNNSGMWITDYTPINIYITLQNAEEVDLLDPEHPDSIVAHFKGESYLADTVGYNRNTTRYYMPRMYGLKYTQLEEGLNVLYFGEIDGGETYNEEPLTIEWPDGTTDVISINSEIKRNKKDGYPEVVNRYYKLNGKEVARDIFDPLIHIIK